MIFLIRKVRYWSRRKQMRKIRWRLMGQNGGDGYIAKLFIYFLLSVTAYLYLQPILYMVTTMMMNLNDLLNPAVKWIPRHIEWSNLAKAWEGLQYTKAFGYTVTISFVCSVLQVAICSITGFSLAKFKIPGRNIILLLIILTFLVPPQIIIIPLYIIYSKLGWLNTPFVFIIPALFGQGLKSALFIIIFYQFFRSMPDNLIEAAKLDGATNFYLFWRIILPLSLSACLVVFLFSFIWYWNMYYEPSMFMSKGFQPLSIRLDNIEAILEPKKQIQNVIGGVSNPITESIKMAASFLILLPPLIVYMIAQRWFVEGIERTGTIE